MQSVHVWCRHSDIWRRKSSPSRSARLRGVLGKFLTCTRQGTACQSPRNRHLGNLLDVRHRASAVCFGFADRLRGCQASRLLRNPGSKLALLTSDSTRTLNQRDQWKGVPLMTMRVSCAEERSPHLVHAAVTAALVALGEGQAPRPHSGFGVVGVLFFRAAAGQGRADGRDAARFEVGAGLLAARQLLPSHLSAREGHWSWSVDAPNHASTQRPYSGWG